MADHQDRRRIALLPAPDVEHFGAQTFRGQGVDLAERLVHKKDFGVDDESAGHAHPLLHTTGKLARIGILKAAQAHASDSLLGALGGLRSLHRACIQHGLDVLPDRHPRKEGETLKHDRDTRIQAMQRLAAIQYVTVARFDQAGEDPQHRRLSGARGTEECHNFVLGDRNGNVLEDPEWLAVGQDEVMRDVTRLAQDLRLIQSLRLLLGIEGLRVHVIC